MMATVTVPSVATRDNLIREIRGIRENLIPPEACPIPAQIVPDKDDDVDAAPSQAPAPEEVSNDKPLDDDVKKNAYRDKGDEGIQKKNADIISLVPPSLLLEPPSRRYKTIDKISKSMSGVSGGVSGGHDHGDPSRRSHGYSAFIGRHSKEGFDSDGSSDATSDGSAYASSYASYQRLKNHRSDSTYKRSMFVGADRMTSSNSSSGYRRRGPELLPTKFRYTNHSELRHRSVNDGDVMRKSRALTAAAALAATKKNGDRGVEKEIVIKADERDRKIEVVGGTRAADNGKGDRCEEIVASPLSPKPVATSPGVTSSSRFRRLQVRSWDDNQKAMAMALFLLIGWFLFSFVLTGQKPRDRESTFGHFGRPDGNQPLF